MFAVMSSDHPSLHAESTQHGDSHSEIDNICYQPWRSDNVRLSEPHISKQLTDTLQRATNWPVHYGMLLESRVRHSLLTIVIVRSLARHDIRLGYFPLRRLQRYVNKNVVV